MAVRDGTRSVRPAGLLVLCLFLFNTFNAALYIALGGCCRMGCVT